MNEDWTGNLYLKKEFYALVRKIQYKNVPLIEEGGKIQTGILECFVLKWSDLLKQEAFSNLSSQTDSFPSKNIVMTNVDSNFLFRSIPLQHHYQKKNLSFLVLKGDDAYLASELSKCRDIQVFLALKSKKVEGMAKIHCVIDSVNVLRKGYWEDDFENSEEELKQDEENLPNINSQVGITYDFDCWMDLYGTKVIPSDIIPWDLDIIEDTVFNTTSDRQLIEDSGK
jgi:hypothetical protein